MDGQRITGRWPVDLSYDVHDDSTCSIIIVIGRIGRRVHTDLTVLQRRYRIQRPQVIRSAYCHGLLDLIHADPHCAGPVPNAQALLYCATGWRTLLWPDNNLPQAL